MVEITRKYYCDLCKKEEATTYRTLAKFNTEQNEGRIVTPYITSTNIDVCDECLEKIVVLNGEGAQGNNKFWINKK